MSSHHSRTTPPNMHAPQPLVSLVTARADAALGRRTLVFSRRPIQALAAPLEGAYPSTLSHPLLQPGPSSCDFS